MKSLKELFPNKKLVIDQIIHYFNKELVELKAAALATYDAATNEESKAENEYDTRGLEASYLAGAQAQRVSQVEELIYHLGELNIREYSESVAISSTAILELEYLNKKMKVIILPSGGGVHLRINDEILQIVTPQSPLGEALMGMYVGDVAIVDVGSVTKEYEILDIC